MNDISVPTSEKDAELNTRKVELSQLLRANSISATYEHCAKLIKNQRTLGNKKLHVSKFFKRLLLITSARCF